MIEVIPSINVQTVEEARERIKKVEPFVSWCHLDVTDGIFSPHKTWNNPADLARLETTLNAEAHLMVRNPEEVFDQWFAHPIKRIIIHVEATTAIASIIEKCRRAGIQIGLAIKPDTPWQALQPWFGQVDLLQTLMVSPGPSGQAPQEVSYEKIRSLHEACSDCSLEADGGINRTNIERVTQSGANLIVAGSAIFDAENIGQAITALRNS